MAWPPDSEAALGGISQANAPRVQAGGADAATKKIATGLLLAATGAIAFGAKAIIVKLAYRHGVDAVTLIMLRMLFALPVFLLMGWWAGRGKQPLSRRDWAGVAGLGFSGYYLSSYMDFLGMQYISASLERLILYLNPTLVLVLGWLLYGRRVSLRQALAMALSYCGILLVFFRELRHEGAQSALGAVLCFDSAALYAAYLVYSGELVRRLGSMRLVGLATSIACLCCIAQFLLLRPLSAAWVPPPVLWLSVLNATLCTALPVLLIMMAVERLGAGLTAQTGMIGPLSTLVMGVLILGEPLDGWLVAGTALVLSGIYIVSRTPQSLAAPGAATGVD